MECKYPVALWQNLRCNRNVHFQDLNTHKLTRETAKCSHPKWITHNYAIGIWPEWQQLPSVCSDGAYSLFKSHSWWTCRIFRTLLACFSKRPQIVSSQDYVDLFQGPRFPEGAESFDRKPIFRVANLELSLTLRHSILENAVKSISPIGTSHPHFHSILSYPSIMPLLWYAFYKLNCTEVVYGDLHDNEIESLRRNTIAALRRYRIEFTLIQLE